MLQGRQGKVLDLISQDLSGKLIVNRQTLSHISQFKGEYCFLSICGEYRSGKSFLLNSLFFDYEGFQTSGSTQACTKGINVWSEPVRHDGHLIWLLDTQGFGSTEKDSSYDGKIFLINLLVSNLLLYNSFGAIDQNTVAKLALVCQQAKFLQEKVPDVTLFWILRDFSLEMVDKEGRQLTEDQYLQECLKEGSIKGEKQLLKTVFPQRHCATLIRPVIDQAKLSHLQQINKTYLRQEFKQQIQTLRSRLQRSLQVKKVQGVVICDKNVQLVVCEFAEAMNKSELQWDLNCSYERVKQFQRELLKQKLVELVSAKVDNVKKLLPVKQEHLTYLEKQISGLVKQQLEEIKQYTSEAFVKIMESQINETARKEVQKVEKTNVQCIAQQVKDYLYRRLIELYPQIIVLGHSQLENKLEQILLPFRQQYNQKYAAYFSKERDLEYFYTSFMEKQIRKLFYEVTKRWRNQQKELQSKLQELKKFKKNIEEELRRNKEQKQKSIRSLQQYRRQEGRSLSKIKQQIQYAFREEMTLVVKDYEQQLRTSQQQKEKMQKDLRIQLQICLQQKAAQSTTWHYQKQGLVQKIQLQKQKWEMINIKYEQLKGSFDFETQQIRNSCENKLKITEMRFNEASNTLATERRKFHMLSEERRVEEGQLLRQIQEQNEQIAELTNQIKELQAKYKSELQKILIQQKQILVKTITNKIQQYEYKCKLYEGKLQESALALKDLEFYSRKNDELEIEVRELKSKLEDESDRANSLQSKVGKTEVELNQQQEYFDRVREELEKEISLANQNLYNNRKFIKEVEDRHQQDVQYYRRKIEAELNQQSNSQAAAHQENMRQNKAILEQKFEKERAQLKEIIRNNYEQVETLKLQKSSLANQLQKIYAILSEIKKSHQLSTKYNQEASFDQCQGSENSFQLPKISQCPEQYSRHLDFSDKKQKFQKMHYMAQQIFEINESLQQQIKIFAIERQALKKELELHLQKVESYESHLNKANYQNKQLKAEVEQLRKKCVGLQNLKKSLQSAQQNYESVEKELAILKRELEAKNAMNQHKQESMKGNLHIYKQTVTQLSEENKLATDKLRALAQKNHTLEQELQRFNLWAQEVQARDSRSHVYSSGVAYSSQSLDLQGEKIKDLENEIKRLTKRSQDQKTLKHQKEGRKEGLLSSYLAQNRGAQLQELRQQNAQLYKRLEEMHENELKQMQQKKINRKKQLQAEQGKYIALKEQYEQYKRKAKEIIAQLQAHLENQVLQNISLKKQFKDLEDNIIKKHEFQKKHTLLQVESLRHDKETMNELYSKKVAILQQEINAKTNQLDRRLAQTQLRYERQRQEAYREMNGVGLEGERHRLKYEHLLKVNNQLLKEIQQLKSKAHQITLKEKYKAKIANLFNA